MKPVTSATNVILQVLTVIIVLYILYKIGRISQPLLRDMIYKLITKGKQKLVELDVTDSEIKKFEGMPDEIKKRLPFTIYTKGKDGEIDKIIIPTWASRFIKLAIPVITYADPWIKKILSKALPHANGGQEDHKLMDSIKEHLLELGNTRHLDKPDDGEK